MTLGFPTYIHILFIVHDYIIQHEFHGTHMHENNAVLSCVNNEQINEPVIESNLCTCAVLWLVEDCQTPPGGRLLE